MTKPATTNGADKTRIRIGPVRLSYAKLAEPQYQTKEDGSVDTESERARSCQLLIPKSSKDDLQTIKTAMTAAAVKKFGTETAKKLWNLPADKFKKPLHDPAKDPDRDGPEYEGMYYMNAKALERFPVGFALPNRQRVETPDEIARNFYSGAWVYITLTCFGYSERSKGVAFGIRNLLKVKDDTRLDNMSTAEEDFADLMSDDDDDMFSDADPLSEDEFGL